MNVPDEINARIISVLTFVFVCFGGRIAAGNGLVELRVDRVFGYSVESIVPSSRVSESQPD